MEGWLVATEGGIKARGWHGQTGAHAWTRPEKCGRGVRRNRNGEKTENMRNARQPPLADAELTHFAEQRAAAHVQHEGRLALMPTTGVQGLHNAVALGLAR